MGTLPKEELKAKQLEKVIYFAAHMVTCGHGRRHADLGPAQGSGEEIRRNRRSEVKASTTSSRRSRLAPRTRVRRRQGIRTARPAARHREGNLTAVRSRFAEERELAKQAFTTSNALTSRQIIEDEVLYREMAFATASTSKAAWSQHASFV